MNMPLPLRKFMLTAHITTSVGWLGAVAGFLTLSVSGLINRDAQLARASYLSMELLAWYVIVPLSFASLLTGLIQSLGTTWGLFRHYWIVFKLIINVASSFLLLVHMQPITRLASIAAQTTVVTNDHHLLQIQLVADASYALVALLVATTLSVYKPRGLTSYGWRKQHERRMLTQP